MTVFRRDVVATPPRERRPKGSVPPGSSARGAIIGVMACLAIGTGVAQSGVPLSTPSANATGGTGSLQLPHDLSAVGMFLHADLVVQAVMVGLALASVLTWVILVAKVLELAAARARVRTAIAALAQASTLEDAATKLARRHGPAVRLVEAALAETERSRELPADGTKERAAALLGRIEGRAGRAMGRGTGLLATVGSTAPFVGLFGTVWGIMNSFIGIATTNTTNLAVVAPGIAEALLATATGLVAAIPAVVIYNLFARAITGYRQQLGDASSEVLRLLSRDLDREASGLAGGATAGRRAAE